MRAIVESHTQADPEVKSARRYTNLSAKEVLAALKSQKGYSDESLPSERTMRDILNRLGYRLQRIRKAKPLKKRKETDAVFDNVRAAREQYENDPETVEISSDAKAKVSEGEYSRGEKGRTDAQGDLPQALDHDPPAKRKWTPLGILVLASGALTMICGGTRSRRRGATSSGW